MKKVLLLDDDSAQLSVRQLLLERMGGIQSRTATDAEAALALLRSEAGASIGAVVTDHVMPDMNGPEFVRAVRSFDPQIPVIVVSGLPDADIAYEGLNVRFLMKPCEPSDLIALIRSALDNERPRVSA